MAWRSFVIDKTLLSESGIQTPQHHGRRCHPLWCRRLPSDRNLLIPNQRSKRVLSKVDYLIHWSLTMVLVTVMTSVAVVPKSQPPPSHDEDTNNRFLAHTEWVTTPGRCWSRGRVSPSVPSTGVNFYVRQGKVLASSIS